MDNTNKKNLSVIDKGLAIEGNIASNGSLIIKGSLKGTIEGESVVIAQDGYVQAETKVANITIAGVFQGDITVTRDLIILSTGSCSGKVRCGNLTVESGGVLNAEVVNTGEDAELVAAEAAVADSV
ncbi:MAG: polymer-forming cytoskeletal protein [Thermodesulfobacteriota bacterium]|nr:polymer-forming cytoskeletal protein [Thermodesulfobacteriota bacterium]